MDFSGYARDKFDAYFSHHDRTTVRRGDYELDLKTLSPEKLASALNAAYMMASMTSNFTMRAFANAESWALRNQILELVNGKLEVVMFDNEWL